MSSESHKTLVKISLAPDTFGTTLALIFVDRFGMRADEDHEYHQVSPLQWDPQTVHLEMAAYLGEPLSDHNFSKMMAAIHVWTDHKFFKSLRYFNDLCIALSGHGLPDEDVWEPAEAEDIAWGVTEAILLAPPAEEDQEPFSPEVIGFIALMLEHAGIHHPEGILQLGGLPEKTSARLRFALSHDPAALEQAEQGSRDRSSGITELLRQRLAGLAQQLRELPLQTAGGVERAARMADLIDTRQVASKATT